MNPCGVYGLKENKEWVSVGIEHDTADFTVESLSRRWRRLGRRSYPNASELTITADTGGSNSYRSRAWSVALQRLADKTHLRIRVHHLPPETSTWNKIEYRLFCHSTKNWRAPPLTSRQAVVESIGKTTTTTGLRVRAELDDNNYPVGKKVSDDELAVVQMRCDKFHGEWNDSNLPRK